jgi:hypothetical protein
MILSPNLAAFMTACKFSPGRTTNVAALHGTQRSSNKPDSSPPERIVLTIRIITRIIIFEAHKRIQFSAQSVFHHSSDSVPAAAIG